MNGRERLRVATAVVPAPIAFDERDLRAAQAEGFESGFMAGMGTLAVLEGCIAILAAAILWWFSK